MTNFYKKKKKVDERERDNMFEAWVAMHMGKFWYKEFERTRHERQRPNQLVVFFSLLENQMHGKYVSIMNLSYAK